jgi:hypothetical protein
LVAVNVADADKDDPGYACATILQPKMALQSADSHIDSDDIRLYGTDLGAFLVGFMGSEG